jgi:hypothetical protein
MKINNFGVTRPRHDQLFDLICQELDRRPGPDMGISIVPNTLPFVDARYTSRVLISTVLGLSAFVMETSEQELNLIMVEHELPKGQELGLRMFRNGSWPEIEFVFGCRNVSGNQAALAARRVFEFFYSKYYSSHTRLYSRAGQTPSIPSVSDASKQMFPDIKNVRSLDMATIEH